MEQTMQQSQDKTVTLNGVLFSINKLTNTFIESYFCIMFSNKFSESSKNEINLLFPKDIDPFGIYGQRYMRQIAYRLTNGKYQYPYSNQKMINSLMPQEDGDRFLSF